MRSPWHARLGLFLLVVLSGSLILLTSVRSAAQATSLSITLSPNVGPPTTVTKVQGTGFKSSESVSIDFDTKLMALITASTRGSFLVTLPIPRLAHPGDHLIQAIGQTSGRRALAHFLVRTDWAQIGFGPSHTRHNPYENVLSSSNVSALTLDWSYTKGSTIKSSPAVANGVVYFEDNTSLYAVDAVTGAVKWSNPMSGSETSPAVANGVVYVDSCDDNLYALDARTGALKWSNPAGFSERSSPAVANGVVYFEGIISLYAVDAVTGAVKWSNPTGANGSDTSPAVANGVVYFEDTDNTSLYAVDAVTGAVKWSYPIGGGGSSPAVANGVVYVSSDKLYALDAVTGALRWSNPEGGSGWTDPAVANGVVYVGSVDTKLYALDAVTGIVKWNYTTGGDIESSPAVANGVVYVGSDDHNLYAFHLPGMS